MPQSEEIEGSPPADDSPAAAEPYSLALPVLFLSGAAAALLCFLLLLYSSVTLKTHGGHSRGAVIQVEPRRTTDDRGRSTTRYFSTIRYTAEDGTPHLLVIESRYKFGAEVSVLYERDAPDRGKVETLTGLWLGPLVCAALALLLGAAGLSFLAVVLERSKTRRRLRRYGRRVQARVTAVNKQELKRPAKHARSGKAPYSLEVVCEASLPDGSVRRFVCTGIRRQLDSSLVGVLTNVYVDPDDPELYFVDVEGISPFSQPDEAP